MVLENPLVFPMKAVTAVVLLLIGNVCLGFGHNRLADAEDAIASLPAELFAREAMIIDPLAAFGFDLAHDVGDGVRGSETHQNMEVILHAAYGECDSSLSLYETTDIRVEPNFKGLVYEWASTVGSENQMKDKIRMCYGHIVH